MVGAIDRVPVKGTLSYGFLFPVSKKFQSYILYLKIGIPLISNPLFRSPIMSKVFNTAFDSITNEIPFNPDWKNGTGYFDHAVKDRTITVTSKTTDPHGRKIIIVPTPVGNAVVFQRYKNDDSVVVCNVPQWLKVLAGSVGLESNLSEAAIEWVVGNQEIGEADVGVRLNGLVRLIK